VIHFGAVRDHGTGRRRNIRPDPFLYTALDRRRADVIDRFAEGLEELVADTDTAGG
jgi:hypothetical protein